MKLVGATNFFISGPFILEGFFMGLVASVISVVLLKSSYVFLGMYLHDVFPFFPLVRDAFLINSILSGVVVLGVFLGVLGACLSISKILKSTC